ncbi:MAG: T9SS type A sorting domain-containing protein [Flavobacteriales bacterium]|jgi:hypothetical protein|nr:T9SS type A sorting domain-containing protein [Flavobacteriales bacterium]
MKVIGVVVFLLCVLLGEAQTIQLGSGTATNGRRRSSPVNIWYRRAVSQFVYTAAEINALGVSGEAMLTDFGFYVTESPVYSIPNYTIKMKNVTETNVAAAISQNGWTEVKAAFTYNPVAGGYDMFNLDTPFYWDGVSNIAVEICWSQISPTYNASGRLREYTVTNGYRYSWTDAAGNSCGESPATIRNRKPQCQLTFSPVVTTFWTGNINTNWFNAGNWTAGVPIKNINAQIPNGLTNYPVVTGTTAEVKNLLIESNASLSTEGELSIYGNWTNNGTYNALAGKLRFKLLISQANQLDGGNQDFNDITVENANGISFNSGSYNIYGAFAAEGGDIYTNGRLNIASSASSTGRITEIKSKCNYDLDMDDSYGDGWNGGYITVIEDGNPIGTYTASGYGSNTTFSITSGNSFDIQYTSGSWENENTYSIYDDQGVLIFNDGTYPSTGVVFSSTASCATTNPFIGDIEQQRYLSLANDGWRELSSPIIAQTLSNWQDDGLIMANFPGSNFPSFGWTSVYTYEENLANGVKEDGWAPATNITNDLSFEKGHRVYIGTGNFNVSVKGAINYGNQTVTLDYQNTLPSEIAADEDQKGWNLIGNPYPCPIDWDEIESTRKENIDNAVWIWSADAGNYGLYVGNSGGVGTNGVNKNIASSQAFWVHATTVGASLSFTEQDKIDHNTTFVKSFSNNDFIKFSIASNLNGYQDEMLVNFTDQATIGYDVNLDADKLGSPIQDAPELSTVVDGNRDLSLNRVPLNEEMSLPIRATVGISGVYTISVTNFDISDIAACLILEDLYLDSLIVLEDTVAYSFYQTDTTNAPRFLLHVRPSVELTVSNETCVGEGNGEIRLDLFSSQPYTLMWSDGVNTDSTEVNTGSYTIEHLSPGNYTIYSDHPIAGCNAYSKEVLIEDAAPLNLVVDSSDSERYLLSANGGTAPYSFYVDNELASSIPAENGEYLLEVIDDNGCSTSEILLINQSYSGILNHNQLEVSVYPNPVHDILSIKTNYAVNLKLYNAVGALVKSIAPNNTGQIQLNVAEYPAGVYWLLSEDANYRAKVEIIH